MESDYALRVEPFEYLYKGYITQYVLELATIEDEASAIMNLLFLQDMKRKLTRESDIQMVRYYLHALQQDHFPHHTLRPTFRRAQRLIYARDKAIGFLATNATLAELQQTALEQKVPSSYLATMDMPEFEEIEAIEKPEEYALRDTLLLDQFGIKIWNQKR